MKQIIFETNNSWDELLKEEINKKYFLDLILYLEKEYNENIIYPNIDKIFSSLKLTDYYDVKVVIIGQDPYHNKNQANGLAFSVPENVSLPPSLRNIYKEITNDLGIDMSKNGSLNSWAEQGVLLLNSVLTVRENEANSHKNKGWEIFTDKIISLLNLRKQPICFILWGNYAKKKENLITKSQHLILKANHPSPLSASKGFFGCKHFSKVNDFLKSNEMKEINWKN